MNIELCSQKFVISTSSLVELGRSKENSTAIEQEEESGIPAFAAAAGTKERKKLMALGPGWLLLAREAKLCVIYGDTQILYTLHFTHSSRVN